MNLDDELHRILSDDRLNVAVQPGAEERIVAGAQRLRRRRMATASTVGALAVAVLVGGGIVLANAGRDDALPPAERTSTTAPTTTTGTSSTSQPLTSSAAPSDKPKPPADDPETTVSTRTAPPKTTGMQIGPNAFGVLWLGMPFDEAVAAGGTEGSPPDPNSGCVGGYPLLLNGEPAGEVSFGPDGKVMALWPTVDQHTADGVSTGWTAAQVQAVYTGITDEDVSLGFATVEVPGDSLALYELGFTDGVLTRLGLRLPNGFCQD